MVLVGVHPVLMQVPPRYAFSIKATVQPRSASRWARGLPPCPEPITMALYFTGKILLVDRFLINLAGSPNAVGWRRPLGLRRFPGVILDRRPKGLRQPSCRAAVNGCKWLRPTWLR